MNIFGYDGLGDFGVGDFSIGKSGGEQASFQMAAALARSAAAARKVSPKAAKDLSNALHSFGVQTFQGGRVDQFGNPVPVNLPLDSVPGLVVGNVSFGPSAPSSGSLSSVLSRLLHPSTAPASNAIPSWVWWVVGLVVLYLLLD